MISPDDLLAAMPFAGTAGVVIESASAEEVTGRLPWAPERCTAGGVLHGGALVTLADSVGAACAFLNLPPGANTTTVETSTRFFRGVQGGEVRAVARPLHRGRTTIVVQTDLYDTDGRRVAQTTQTQAVLHA
ncbi:PaaI family thioesterase [Actinoallomurus soli]|uniref:PaaI family thioesterase n=1 Tax=Actinoallomurus soli TaxID=2952535 RepID=UPI002092B7E7|nr:PaaI family thioesterase [Actinoallomurus soli]MCO5974038.1 PaaI family thioesterase [Actinoallomurus soli]